MLRPEGEASPPVEAVLAAGDTVLGQWALARIMETTHVVEVEGRHYLLTPAEPDLVDALACVGVAGEDMEDEGVALDWTRGQAVRSGDDWIYPVIIQDGEREPTQADGGSR